MSEPVGLITIPEPVRPDAEHIGYAVRDFDTRQEADAFVRSANVASFAGIRIWERGDAEGNSDPDKCCVFELVPFPL